MHFRFSRAHDGALLSLYIASGAAALLAQAPAGSLPQQLDPFLVQGRDAALVGSAISASQGSVGAAELEARPFLRRGELLEVIPGVVITQHSGSGKANQFFLRGFNLDHGTDFSIAVDGMPVNLRSHAHGQGYADVNFLIPELVAQVDYQKGPYFAEVGDFSAAGAAEFRQFDALPRNFLKVEAGENAFARLVAGGSRRAERGALTTGALELAQDDGPWQEKEDFSRFNGYVRHAWKAGAAEFRLTGMAYRATWRATDQVPQRAVAAGILDRFGTMDASDGGASERASISFDGTWRDGGASTKLNAYAIHHRLDLYSNFTYFLDDPEEGDQFNQRDRRIVAGGALSRSWTTQTDRARSETSVGVQTRADFIDELGLHRTARRARLSTVRDDTVDELSAGVFARRETRWREWLRIEAGLRVDAYRFEVDSDEPRNSGSASDAIASPKLGVALGPWKKSEFYVNAGAGFHSNDARGTTIRVDPLDGLTPVERVTPLARSRGMETGVRLAPVRGLVTTLAVWGLELDSELVFVGDAGGTEPTGRTRRHGIELANFWRVGSRVAFDADFAATRARYRDDAGGGTRIANSISKVATGGVSYGGKVGFFGAVRVRHFGSQPLTEDGAVRAPSSTTVNLQLGWRTEAWELEVDVLNALDRANHDIAYAYTSRLPGEPAEGVNDIHVHPAEPRTVRLAVTRRW